MGHVTYPASTVGQAGVLAQQGVPIAAIARALDVSRAAVSDWVGQDLQQLLAKRALVHDRPLGAPCFTCPMRTDMPRAVYAYLLGLYLGDGCLALAPKGVYKLRIMCCDAYPDLMALCRSAIAAVLPASKVGTIGRIGCTEVYSNSKHWICLFPQHGAGRKHLRSIALDEWQQRIVDEHPRPFLRGLIHSDGCRVINRVHVRGRSYAYLRYFFKNESHDILELFADACDHVGVEWRYNRYNSISVARRRSVALLDEFVGPKS
jgi:hypothetical protein